MGLFDFFKGKKNIQQIAVTEQRREEQEDIRIRGTKDGKKIMIECFSPKTKFTQFYDTTRLIVKKGGVNLEGDIVKDCLISWYNQTDAIMIDYDSRKDYKHILASIDEEKMFADRDYCIYTMTQLLNRKRVEGYLSRGESLEEPETPCGNYVGGVVQNPDGSLKKVFNCTTGRICHNAPYMQHIRDEKRRGREKAIAEKRAKLLRELEELDGNSQK